MPDFEFLVQRHRSEPSKTAMALAPRGAREEHPVVHRFHDAQISNLMNQLGIAERNLDDAGLAAEKVQLTVRDLIVYVLSTARSAFDAGRKYEREIQEHEQ